jgi:hypothetical protein
MHLSSKRAAAKEPSHSGRDPVCDFTDSQAHANTEVWCYSVWFGIEARTTRVRTSAQSL